MANLLIILALVAFAIYRQTAKTPKKQQPKRQKPISYFPGEEEEREEEETPVAEAQPMPTSRPRRPAPQPVKAKPKAPSVPTYDDTGKDIRLRTPSDARRAFIYSEIFKRKY